MNEDQYKAIFSEPVHSGGEKQTSENRAARALDYALDIRKFEIELYWKRATYFWTLIAAAFAAYALTYETSTNHEPWLSFLFSALGLVLSFAWYLVNRGSKFWQNNWERHVDLLENITLGPLYKVVAISHGRNPLTDAAQFSVTKINQMLSLFVTLIWIVLLVKSVGPIAIDRELDWYKFAALFITFLALGTLWKKGRSSIGHTKAKLHERTFEIEN